jgi:hypothetical protein
VQQQQQQQHSEPTEPAETAETAEPAEATEIVRSNSGARTVAGTRGAGKGVVPTNPTAEVVRACDTADEVGALSRRVGAAHLVPSVPRTCSQRCRSAGRGVPLQQVRMDNPQSWVRGPPLPSVAPCPASPAPVL